MIKNINSCEVFDVCCYCYCLFSPCFVLKVNVGHDFNVALREHDPKLCEFDLVNKKLEHLTKVLD